MNIDSLTDRVKGNEGFKSTVYQCSNGFLTIGYGSAIKDLNLSENVASAILVEDLLKLVIKCHERFSWFRHMPDIVQEVIVEMCYQMGIVGFSEFQKTIKYFQNGELILASIEMLESKWARTDSPSRAKRLSDLVANGV